MSLGVWCIPPYTPFLRRPPCLLPPLPSGDECRPRRPGFSRHGTCQQSSSTAALACVVTLMTTATNAPSPISTISTISTTLPFSVYMFCVFILCVCMLVNPSMILICLGCFLKSQPCRPVSKLSSLSCGTLPFRAVSCCLYHLLRLHVHV
jgi:hypothetical protein